MLGDDAASVVARVTMSGTELTAKAIYELMKAMINKKNRPVPLKHGQQDIKDLNLHNEYLTPIPCNTMSMMDLKKSLKKHGVDFAVVKDDANRFQVYFKGKDVERLLAAMENVLPSEPTGPKVIETLKAKKEAIQKAAQEMGSKTPGIGAGPKVPETKAGPQPER